MSEPAPRPRPWLRRMPGRDPGEEGRASTPLELLFDLTFVVAVAQAATQLHRALAQGQAGHALAGYAAAFFGLWWAWVNFTWFASAYDTDDVAYRLLTMLRMAGSRAAAGVRVVVVVFQAHRHREHPAIAALDVCVGARTPSDFRRGRGPRRIAIPVAAFIVVLNLLNTRVSGQPVLFGLALLTAALVLATAAVTPILTLPLGTVIMVVLVALLLACHLTVAHRATRLAEPSSFSDNPVGFRAGYAPSGPPGAVQIRP